MSSVGPSPGKRVPRGLGCLSAAVAVLLLGMSGTAMAIWHHRALPDVGLGVATAAFGLLGVDLWREGTRDTWAGYQPPPGIDFFPTLHEAPYGFRLPRPACEAEGIACNITRGHVAGAEWCGYESVGKDGHRSWALVVPMTVRIADWEWSCSENDDEELPPASMVALLERSEGLYGVSWGAGLLHVSVFDSSPDQLPAHVAATGKIIEEMRRLSMSGSIPAGHDEACIC